MFLHEKMFPNALFLLYKSWCPFRVSFIFMWVIYYLTAKKNPTKMSDKSIRSDSNK